MEQNIKISGRSMAMLFVCPNNKECVKKGGFALCNECMVEALDIVNAKESTNNLSTSTRAKRTGIISPTSHKKRRGRINRDNVRSRADKLKENETIECCNAHNDIKKLEQLLDDACYTLKSSQNHCNEQTFFLLHFFCIFHCMNLGAIKRLRRLAHAPKLQ